MASSHSGITAWMATIRTAMLDDPGRQLLEDRVQSQGFLFLEEYLDSIRASSKQESAIVDLVKTPGRKRDAPKKTRAAGAAAARAQAAMTFSLEDDGGKENHGPVNRFHEALLQAKQSTEREPAVRQPLSPQRSVPIPQALPSKSRTVTITETVEEHFIDISSSPAPALPSDTEKECTIHDPLPEVSFSPRTEGNKELSMIAEDDEPISTLPVSTKHSTLPSSPSSRSRFALRVQPPAEEEYDTAPLAMEIDAPTEAYHSSSHSPGTTREASPVEQLEPVRSTSLPSPTSSSTPLYSPDDENPMGLSRKQSAPRFPSIPQPSPLKKSVHPGSGTAPAVNATVPVLPPANVVASKRTSWLTKAREAKAAKVADFGSKLTGAGAFSHAPLSVAPHTGHLKRKSDDMMSNGEYDAAAESSTSTERRSKLQKTYQDLAAEAMELDVHLNYTEKSTPPELSGSAGDASENVGRPLEGALGQLRKTVEGMGTKGSKSNGISFGGALAAELAKARAAAEARVASRKDSTAESQEHRSIRPSLSEPAPPHSSVAAYDSSSQAEVLAPHVLQENDRRLSVSDLMPKEPTVRSTKGSNPREANKSTSTTPPGSPRQSVRMPPPPVFNKPPADFVPPPIASDRPAERTGLLGEFSFKLPTSSAYSLRPPIGLGIQPFSKPNSQPDSGPSSQSTVFSDAIFDPQRYSSTQDSVYTSQESQYKYVELEEPAPITTSTNDDDDTWGLDEKIAATDQQWTPFAATTPAFGDTDTWDTATGEPRKNAFGFPYVNSQSTTGTWSSTHSNEAFTRSILASEHRAGVTDESHPSREEQNMPRAEELSGHPSNTRMGKESDMQSIRSQMSGVSSSDESQPSGFIGQATKFVTGMFGNGTASAKKDKNQLKSLQRAAAAARKQKEEQDKKSVRLKDMEARRQAALQRKAEEDRLRAEEEERRAKEDAERRKKEREELTGKRPVKQTALEKKPSEDDVKKKKVFVEVPKPVYKDKRQPAPGPSKHTKPSPAIKPRALTKQTSTSTLSDKPKAGTALAKGKDRVTTVDDSDMESKAGPASKMARANAGPSKPKPEPPAEREWIDLPEPNSEYSDSEDEGKEKKYPIAPWARSPSLMSHLDRQQAIDPDDIFGPIRPLRMEEMFRTRQSRFRARTSSANWSGPDGLTELETREYARRMGYQ